MTVASLVCDNDVTAFSCHPIISTAGEVRRDAVLEVEAVELHGSLQAGIRLPATHAQGSTHWHVILQQLVSLGDLLVCFVQTVLQLGENSMAILKNTTIFTIPARSDVDQMVR